MTSLNIKCIVYGVCVMCMILKFNSFRFLLYIYTFIHLYILRSLFIYIFDISFDIQRFEINSNNFDMMLL